MEGQSGVLAQCGITWRTGTCSLNILAAGREGMTGVKVLPILVVLVRSFLRRFLKEKLPGSFVPQTSPHCGDPLTALADTS